MNILLFGASGMIGGRVLRECLLSPDVAQVVSVVRTSGTVRHAKLREVVHGDFLDFSGIQADAFSDIDAVFFCLGVSSAGMSEADYTRITYDMTLAAAQALVAASPGASFVYVSGAGADTSERSRTMWARVRGRTENALLGLPLKVCIFRLGLVQPLDGITSRTRTYRLFYGATRPLLPLLRRLFPHSVTTTGQVGRAMLQVARRHPSQALLDSAAINAL